MPIKNYAEQESSSLRTTIRFFLITLILFLQACSTTVPYSSYNYNYKRYRLSADSPPAFRINARKIPNAIPKTEPLSKRGNPKSYVVFGRRYYVMRSAKGYHAKGIASWYGMKFHRFQTSNGETYNVAGMTAAHKTLPLPTYVQVTNLRNGKKIIVKVNDRGPFVCNRLIDLSYAAAKKLDMTGTGTAPVSVIAITPSRTHLALNKATQHSIKPSPHTKHHVPFIQLGLFREHLSAQKLALLVKRWTHSPVKIQPTLVHKRTYYQVVIGPLPNTKSSHQLSQQLQLAGLNISRSKEFKT